MQSIQKLFCMKYNQLSTQGGLMRTRSWTVLSGIALAVIGGLTLFPQNRGGKPVAMPQAVAYLRYFLRGT
jgi:hypothetical protein